MTEKKKVITTPKEMYDKVAIDYRNNSVELSGTYFSFDVSMPKIDILTVYQELQHDINGDEVDFPQEDHSLLETYTGDCESYLMSLNDKPEYTRYNDDEKCDFVL